MDAPDFSEAKTRKVFIDEAGQDQDDDSDAENLDIPIHAFDLIIADECHRGYTAQEESKWREVLNHFDAIKIGLTATPAAHTTAFFKNIVYRYDYERAVREGFLVDSTPWPSNRTSPYGGFS